MSASSRGLRAVALALLSVLTATLLIGATAGSAEAGERRERKIDRALEVARNQIGDPYRYGAAGPAAFDCSGLTMFAYGRAGIRLPHSSDAQARAVRPVKRHHMRPGDLMFFHDGGGIYHVGMFVGWRDGRRVILHSSYSGRPVQRDRVWSGNWFGGTLRNRH